MSKLSNILFFFALLAVASTLRIPKRSNADPRDQLQQIFNGFWEQGGLSGPKTAVGCFVDDSPAQTVKFFGELTEALANSQYLKVPTIVYTYQKNLPASVGECTKTNPEIRQVSAVYGTEDITLLQLFAKVQKYVVGHTESIHEAFVQLDMEFKAGNFNIYGRDAGVLLLHIMNDNSTEEIAV